MFESPVVFVKLCLFHLKAMFFEQKQAGLVQHFDYTNVEGVEAFLVCVVDGCALFYYKLHHIDIALG